MRLSRSLLTTLALASSLTTTACNRNEPAATGEAPADDAPTETPPTRTPTPLPDEGPLPSLRTGVQQVESLPAIEVELLAQASEKASEKPGGAHYYEFALPRQGFDEVVRVQLDGSAHALATFDRSSTEGRVLVRMPSAAEPATQLSGTAFISVDRPGGRVWQAQPFTAKGPAKASEVVELPGRWANAFASELRAENRPWWMTGPSHPWREFAAGRIQALAAGRDAAPGVGFDPGMRPRRTDLAQLMHTTTAATSMQEALQHDRGLRLAFDAGEKTIPIEQLQRPALVAHPFAQMRAALPNPEGGTPEPLAAAAPSEFWYLRFDDIRVLLRVLDEADAWLTPVAQIMEERAEVRDLSQRYQRQLGLRRTGLAKTLGHTVIERVAVMGSDPYLREGSDLTLVFALRNQTVFDTELARHMDEYRGEVPGIAETTITHGSHTITVQRDPKGVVRQHRAFVAAQQLALVSNSEQAIKAVLDAIDGKRRRLADDEDLAYMLARDPGEHDGFAFLGDHFIAEVVGPRQKVLAARRQEALAELLTPGFAALLYGWLEGKAPADVEALIAAGLLDRGELQHAEGTPISFVPGSAATSSWGSPASLVPLIDLPAPTLVSEAERFAYDTFSRDYQDYWRRFIDPIAIRIDVDESAGALASATVDIRVLPLIEGTDYGDIEEVVGTERIEVPAIDDGLQMVWAVGADSDLRRELDRSASLLTGKADIGLGWLGAWVMVGTLDRRSLLDMLVAVEKDIQLPEGKLAQAIDIDEDLRLARLAGKLPVYAAAHVRNPVGLVATLTAIKAALNEVAPGMVEWGEHSRHRDYPIVKIGVNPRAPGEFADFADAIALYYVQADDVFAVALDPLILQSVIDRIVDGGGPKQGVEGGPQFVMDARVAEARPGWTALAWALQGQANRTQTAARSSAEILLRGDPTITDPTQLRARANDYFGAYPVSASGSSEFSLGSHGVADPIHGSEIAPAYPQLPVPGSPIAALMQRLTGLQASVAFDREPGKLEPPARSLHTRVQLHLGAAQE